METTATYEELRSEARWAAIPGWVVAESEKGYTWQEREAWCPTDSRAEREDVEERLVEQLQQLFGQPALA